MRAGADRRLHDLPRGRRRLLRRLDPGARRRQPARSTSGCTTSRRGADDPRRSVDDSPFGGGAGMVLMPEPLFRCVEAVRRPAPAAVPADARRPALRPVGGRRAGGLRTAALAAGSRCCAGATRGWTSGWPTTWSTASCRWATTCWPAGSWRRWWWSRRWPGCCPTCWATRTRRADESFSERAARVPPVHPAGRRSGAGRCPRCCARATTARWRPGGAPRRSLRTAERRPDLLERLVRASALERQRRAGPGRARLRCSVRHCADRAAPTEPE